MIRVSGVSVRFGRRTAVRDVSFEIGAGEVVGLVGQNGAGKTTLLRAIAGYLAPDAGSIRVDGEIGYLAEGAPAYPEMRVEAFLAFRARCKGVARARVAERVEAAMAVARIAERRRSAIGTLSRGLRQRVGVADALVADPPIALLDEPATGLDPVQVRELRALLAEQRGKRTVVLSSHQLGEIAAVATRVLVLADGALVADAAPDELGSLEDALVALAGKGAP